MNFSAKTSRSLSQLFLPPSNSIHSQGQPEIPNDITNQTKFSLRGGGNTKSKPEPSKSPLQEVTCVASCEQSHYIICGFADGSLKIVDIHKSKATLTLEKAHRTEICALAYSHDGRYAASASLDGTVRVMDLKESGKYYILKNIFRNPEALIISRDNKYVIGGFRGKVRVFGLKGGKCIRTMKSKFIDNVSSLFMTKNSRYIVVNFSQPLNLEINQEHQPIRLWSLYNEKFVKSFYCNLLGPWKALAFTKNDEALIFSAAQNIGFWNFRTGQVIRKILLLSHEPIIALHPTVDNKYFVCLYARNKMEVFDMVTMKRLITIEEKIAADELYDMSLANGSQYIILKGILGTIKIYRFPQINQNVCAYFQSKTMSYLPKSSS